jgi:hypothetical protein
MTRILVTIPHYIGRSPKAMAAGAPATNRMSSAHDKMKPLRVEALRQSLVSLGVKFGSAVYRLDVGTERTLGGSIAMAETKTRLDVEILTVGDHHLLAEFNLPPWARQREMNCDPTELAFLCHDALAERLGDYDWYCCLEDDILLYDPLFFEKLTWFNSLFGDDKLLSPNRYEIFQETLKVYVDGEGHGLLRQAWRYRELSEVSGDYAGREMHFHAPVNPMAGCFFLNARQMERWMKAPGFGDRDDGDFNPLEAAGFLHQRTVFDFFRPSLQNASFLEVVHGVPRLSYGKTPRALLTKEIAARFPRR